jgi:hypothetical protein
MVLVPIVPALPGVMVVERVSGLAVREQVAGTVTETLTPAEESAEALGEERIESDKRVRIVRDEAKRVVRL